MCIDLFNSYMCNIFGDKIMEEVINRLSEKIKELKEKGTSDIQEENHSISPKAFLYYLEEIMGKYDPKQECPYDI